MAWVVAPDGEVEPPPCIIVHRLLTLCEERRFGAAAPAIYWAMVCLTGPCPDKCKEHTP